MQIVIRQVSGLGNQLFQHAAGRFYARRYAASLRMATDLPHRAVSHGYPRPFLLPNFSIETPMHPLSALDRTIFSVRPGLSHLGAALRKSLGIQIFHEPAQQHHTFLPDLPLQPSLRTLYLVGYWQTHQIVHEVEDVLRRDLAFRHPPGALTQAVLDRIASTPNPVSLHVRRGDYTLAVEGNIALPISYYAQAINYFQSRLKNPTFFVFSDDIAFARANLPLPPTTVFVDHNNDATSQEDLRLMSACRHHIIANSSFSWWGAWLNPRPDKIVYAPKCWHLHPQSYYPQLFPPHWVLGSF